MKLAERSLHASRTSAESNGEDFFSSSTRGAWRGNSRSQDFPRLARDSGRRLARRARSPGFRLGTSAAAVARLLATPRARERDERSPFVAQNGVRAPIAAQVARTVARETQENAGENCAATTRAYSHCSGRECVVVLRLRFPRRLSTRDESDPGRVTRTRPPVNRPAS